MDGRRVSTVKVQRIEKPAEAAVGSHVAQAVPEASLKTKAQTKQ
jgi:hypothetical protein